MVPKARTFYELDSFKLQRAAYLANLIAVIGYSNDAADHHPLRTDMQINLLRKEADEILALLLDQIAKENQDA